MLLQTVLQSNPSKGIDQHASQAHEKHSPGWQTRFEMIKKLHGLFNGLCHGTSIDDWVCLALDDRHRPADYFSAISSKRLPFLNDRMFLPTRLYFKMSIPKVCLNATVLLPWTLRYVRDTFDSLFIKDFFALQVGILGF